MNVFAKIFLSVLAVAAGTYYVFCGIRLFENRSDTNAYGPVVYFGACTGQIAIGLTLVGVGLRFLRSE